MLSGAPRARAPQGNPENKILQVSVFSRVPRERLSLVRAGLRPAQFLLVLFLQFEACVFASLMPPPPPKRHEGIPSSTLKRASPNALGGARFGAEEGLPSCLFAQAGASGTCAGG